MTPTQVIDAFAASLNGGDLEGALSLYEPGAVFEPEPGRRVQGREAIRDALTGFFAIQPRISGEIQKVVEAGDVALVVNRWQLSGTDPDGKPISMGGVSSDVVRRQPDGTWKIAIDDPWGAP